MSSGRKSEINTEERKAEERSLAALRIQRKQRLEQLVHKRTSNFNYIKKIHLGGSYWLNVMLFTSQDIQRLVAAAVPKSRAVIYYYLGLSMYNLLDICTGTSTVQAFSQLMEEFEYLCSGSGMQSVKLLMAKNSNCIYPKTPNCEGEELIKPSMYKFQSYVVYEHLRTPPLAFELDYVEVVISLCDAFAKLYEKFLVDECFLNPVVYEAIVKLDTRVKHHFINLISKEFTDYSSKCVSAETETLRFSFAK